MGMVNDKLKELEHKGFIISNDNRSVTCTTENASNLFYKYYVDSNYILGSVPAWNEDLKMVECDILFNAIEKFANYINIETYHYLHELVSLNDILKFKDVISNNIEVTESIYDIIEYCESFVDDVLIEIKELLDEL